MCGIVGQVNRRNSIDKALFNKRRDTLSHRGPDGFGSSFFQEGRVALGHRRLAIVDLSVQGQQPMPNEDGSIWVSCNGEIYNYPTLRKQLEAAGHRFRSNSDNEVLLHAYEEWGIAMFSRLKGMFAFGIWDDRKQELLLARDRFGIKPLYYYPGADHFAFASELKAIVADPSVPRVLDQNAVNDFFLCRSVAAPRSIWEGIYKLQPAHFLVLKTDGSWRTQKYWELKGTADERPLAEVLERVDELLRKSVRQHLQADVPLGLLLSGGFDSSTLAYYMAELNQPCQSFTIGFAQQEWSEHEAAREAAAHFKTKHEELFVGQELYDKLETTAYFYDEPFGGVSFLPTFELARMASEKLKVVLAGDGGDELFAGYKWYQNYFTPWYHHPRAAIRNVLNKEQGPKAHYQRAMNWSGWQLSDLSQLYGEGMSFSGKYEPTLFSAALSQDPVKAIQQLDYQYFLPEVVLHKIDRASMAHGLEVRVPFLDHELTEYIQQLSSSLYFTKGKNKALLYELMRKRFPSSLLAKPKKGFGMPLKHFFEESHFPADWEEWGVFGDRLINPVYVKRLLQQKAFGKLWPILIFMVWYKRWK